MERTSKHSPRIDDELDTRAQGGDVESRREFLRTEAPTEEDIVGDSGSLDFANPDARNDLARFLDPSIFPTDGKTLVENAEANGAPDAVIGALRQLPEEESFENVEQAWEWLGGEVEHRQ